MLAGVDLADDGGVYQVSEDLALIHTLDFFTPIVDDPQDYGAIACANSVSDVYAMGGTPKSALNIVCYPSGELEMSLLKDILQGAIDTAEEGDFSIIGGHCVKDSEPKYGLAVTGFVDPDQLITKQGAEPGDRLVLTKPIGTGMITTAIKKGEAKAQSVEEALMSMKSLNQIGEDLRSRFEVHAGTDVTGYGLLGHLLQILENSGVGAELSCSSVPVLEGIPELAEDGCFPGGTRNNFDSVSDSLDVDSDVEKQQLLTLADAQTSGGLLLCMPGEEVERFRSEIQPGPSYLPEGAVEIGRIREGSPSIRVRS